MDSIESKLYKQDILEHYKNPQNFVLLTVCNFNSSEHNPSCGDSIIINGIIADGMIEQVAFNGTGCVLSIAMASKLTQAVKGKSLSDVMKLDGAIVTELLGIPLGINRMKCGLLSVVALQKGVDAWIKNEQKKS